MHTSVQQCLHLDKISASIEPDGGGSLGRIIQMNLHTEIRYKVKFELLYTASP